MVLRSQVFSADALSHAAFTGALAAPPGVDPRLGLFVATIGVGVDFGLLGLRGKPDDVVTGTVFAWVLGLGVLALSLYTANRSAKNGGAGVSVLFGSIFGLSATTARTAAIVAIAPRRARPRDRATVAVHQPRRGGRRGARRSRPRARRRPRGRRRHGGGGDASGRRAAVARPAQGPAGAAQRLTTRPYLAMALDRDRRRRDGRRPGAQLLVPPPSRRASIIAVATGIYAITFLVRPPRRGFRHGVRQRDRMTIPTPEPDPLTGTRGDQDDLVEVDADDDLPDDGTRKQTDEVDPVVEQGQGAEDAEQLPRAPRSRTLDG